MRKVIIPILIGIALLSLGVIIYDQYQNNKEGLTNTPYYVELTYDEFKEKIDNEDSFIMVIHHTDCAHCKTYIPILRSVAHNNEIYTYGINQANLSDDENKKLKEFASISGTPTTIFIENGKETTTTNRIIGAANRTALIKKFKALGYIK